VSGHESEAGLVAERLAAAMNAHDLDAFVGCFQEGYESDQPAHPYRASARYGLA
jgi:hypothetical protein